MAGRAKSELLSRPRPARLKADSGRRGAAPHDDPPASGASVIPVSEVIVRRLRRRIRTGELTPGEWLREQRLAEEFGAGRNTVREALRALADDGLVECVRFRGARITTPTAQQMFDLLELRAALFGMVARFTCFRATQQTLEEIASKIDELMEAAQTQVDPAILIGKSLAVGALMTRHASQDVRQLIEASDRRTRWHFAHLGLAESVTRRGPTNDWAELRQALLARDAAKAGDAARNILHFLQQEQAMAFLANGGLAADD